MLLKINGIDYNCKDYIPARDLLKIWPGMEMLLENDKITDAVEKANHLSKHGKILWEYVNEFVISPPFTGKESLNILYQFVTHKDFSQIVKDSLKIGG